VVLATEKKQQQKTLIQKTNKQITRNKTRRKKNGKSYQIENKQTKKLLAVCTRTNLSVVLACTKQ
jgi:hypothetical protein